MAGMVSFVKASMSRRRPGTAADMIFDGPRAERISARRRGYAVISQALEEFGTCL